MAKKRPPFGLKQQRYDRYVDSFTMALRQYTHPQDAATLSLRAAHNDPNFMKKQWHRLWRARTLGMFAVNRPDNLGLHEQSYPPRVPKQGATRGDTFMEHLVRLGIAETVAPREDGTALYQLAEAERSKYPKSV